MPIATVNNIQVYYEIHGEGEPAVCMGGWGTYCHKDGRGLARGLTDRYQVLVFDYRGIAQSRDDLHIPASMKLYAADLIGLLDQLGWQQAHLIGLVGMGCGVAQGVALSRPELVRSMVNMGAWSSVDDYLRDQLKLFRTVHREVGFYAFQQFVCIYSFLPEFYNQLGAMHGTIMVFLGVVPLAVGGFGNFVLPLQIGAPDMAFPKLNMFSYWAFFLGGVVMIASFFAPGGAANSGWTSYAPLSVIATQGQTWWLIGMIFLITSSLLGAINFIVTTIQLRAPGLSFGVTRPARNNACGSDANTNPAPVSA